MSMDYVALCKGCRGIVFWVAEEQAEKSAKDIAKTIEAGFSMERMETERVRAFGICEHQGKCEIIPKRENLFTVTSHKQEQQCG